LINWATIAFQGGNTKPNRSFLGLVSSEKTEQLSEQVHRSRRRQNMTIYYVDAVQTDNA